MRSAGGGVSRRGGARQPGKLRRCPKNLYILWAEYESGIGGNKPARQFTREERGKCRFAYCRRKIVWDVIENMCRRNLSVDVAIDRIYDECGGQNTPVNEVMKMLRKFRKSGGNHNLHIDPIPVN